MKKLYKRTHFLIMSSLISFVLILGIGYASVGNLELSIEGDVETVSQDGVFITSVEYVESDGEGTEESVINDFYETVLNSTIYLSDSVSSSTITYAVTVYNKTSDPYMYCGTSYDEEFYDNSDITFDVTGITQKSTILNSNQQITFNIIFRYDDVRIISNNVLNSYIGFLFKKAYAVTYENITNNNYPAYAALGESFAVTFSNMSAGIEVKMNGNVLNSSAYTYKNYTLTIPDVSGKIHVRQLKKYTLTNMVANGSFENGFEEWNFSGASAPEYWGITAVPHHGSKAAYRKAAGLGTHFILQELYWTTGHKYYFFAHGISVHPQPLECNVTNKGGNISVLANPSEYSRASTIYTAGFTGYNKISVNYAKITDNLNIDAIGVIDLTAAFGAGNEPDLSWCDSNIGYFDGTASFYK